MMGQSQRPILLAKALMMGTASFVLIGLGLPLSTQAQEHGEREASEGIPASQPLIAQAVSAPTSLTLITGIQVSPSPNGIQIGIQTQSGSAPHFLPPSPNYRTVLVVDLLDAQLSGGSLSQSNPAPGILSVNVDRRTNDSVRLTIIGSEQLPVVNVQAGDPGVVVSLGESQVPVAVQPTPAPTPVAVDPTPDPAPQTEEDPSVGEDPVAEDLPVLQLEEVVVTATRTAQDIQDIPRSVTVITREELDQQLSVNRNLGDVLGRLVPGFGPPNGIGSSIDFQSLRGRAASVLIDGVPISENVGLGRELRSLDPAVIERIEIVRGPTAIYGGEATGGVINIITRQPSSERLSLTSEVRGVLSLTGEEDRLSSLLRQTISGREGIFSYDFTAAAEFNGGIFDANGDRIFVLAGDGSLSDAETLNLFGKIRFDFDDNQHLQLTANYFNDRREAFILDPAVAATPGTQAASAIKLEDIEIDGGLPERNNTLFNLSYAHIDVLGGELQAQAYYRYYDENGSIPNDERDNPIFENIVRTRWNFEQLGGRLQLNTSLAETLSLLLGADYAHEESEQPFDIFDPNVFDNSNGNTFQRIDTGTFVPPSVLDELGLFTQLQWQPTEQWQLSGGVRYENISFSVDDYTTSNGQPIQGGNLNFDDFAFNVGTVYDVADNISLFASIAQGFSVPAFGRVLRVPPAGFEQVTDALDVTQPQKVTEYEIGVRGSWDSVQTSLTAFYNTSDLGTFFEEGVGGVFVPVRAPERIYGVEATVDSQIGDSWSLGGSFSWSEGENDPLGDGNFMALSSSSIQPFKLSAYVENETLPRWTNRLQTLWVGSRDRAFDAGVDLVPIDSYAVVDYISSITAGSGVIQLGVENLFNTQYFPVASQFLSGFDEQFNVAGRGRTVSLRYQIDW